MNENKYESRLKEMLDAQDDELDFERERKSSKTEEYKKSSARSYVAALCSKSEYCIHDIREKLRKRELSEESQQEIIDFLLKEKFIDESRYCRSYINDKYKYAKWGKIKIAYSLKTKRVADSLIYDTMDEVIDEEIYSENLRKALLDKKKTIKGSDKYEIKSKLFRFAAGRGYESEDISRLLNEIL